MMTSADKSYAILRHNQHAGVYHDWCRLYVSRIFRHVAMMRHFLVKVHPPRMASRYSLLAETDVCRVFLALHSMVTCP